LGFTGIEKQYFAVNKETNKEEAFDSKVLRDVSVKSKSHINPTEKNTKSKYPEIIKNMALIYNQRGETEKALEAMREARAENPDDLNLVLTEANVHYTMGNIEKFKELLEYATEKDPENAELQYNLGVIAAEAKDVANAKKYYQRALELDPNYTNAYINLAALILGQEESIINEMNNLGTSAADDRRYDELREERKQLYYEAIPFLEKALVADPSNIQAAKTLSNIFSATGNDAKAKEYRDLANSLEQ
jgi:tetratricopeptide (TPR) repeat protein